MSKLFTLDFRIISLDLFQTNSLHSHRNEENYMGSTLTPARTKGPDQPTKIQIGQMEPHIQNLAKWSRVASHSGDWTIGNIARQTSRTRIEESTWFKSKNRKWLLHNQHTPAHTGGWARATKSKRLPLLPSISCPTTMWKAYWPLLSA